MHLGRTLVLAGLVLIVLGLCVLAVQKLNLPIGRLPGDIVWHGRRSTIYFPWVTCLVLSALATLLFWFFQRRG